MISIFLVGISLYIRLRMKESPIFQHVKTAGMTSANPLVEAFTHWDNLKRVLISLFGATAGPRIGRVRPFGRVRPGFVRYSAADEPIVCIAIFPPPLSCVLAAGRTMLAMDLGGGVDLSITRSAFVRVDVGDRLVRFPGTVIDPDFIRHDRSFFSHEFRFAAGGGVRF